MLFQGYFVRGLSLAALVSSIAACAPGAYLVKAPTPSGMAYEAPKPQKADLTVVDERRGAEREFHSGLLKATLNVGDAPIDAPKFLAQHLQQELASRGVPMQVSTAGNALPRLNLMTFRVQNHRASGFGPFVTFTYISADLETPSGKKRLGAFIKRGKVPVWSFDEVIEPTFNQPLSLAVKELASKIANHLYGQRAGDKVVNDLIAKLGAPRTPESYLDVYALGFTNHPRAIDTLAQLTADPDEYVRLAAISSLGNLRATAKMDLLKSIYQGDATKLWQDRGMALKAIGDLGTPEANAFLAAELKRWESQGAASLESTWNAQIIRLYI